MTDETTMLSVKIISPHFPLFEKKNMARTDGPTNGETDGLTLFQGCLDTSKIGNECVRDRQTDV